MMIAALRKANRYIRSVVDRKTPFRWKLVYTRFQALLLLKPGSIERAGQQEFYAKAFKALDFNGITGDYVEFGCCTATTFAIAYHESRKLGVNCHFWAFDSFSGLPPQSEEEDEHPKWIENAMSTELQSFHAICSKNGIPADAYSTIAGYFEDTLTRLPALAPPSDIALVYVDCDLYSSTRTVLEFLAPRLKHGMIVAFDDYFCWSSNQVSGEKKALQSFLLHNDQWLFSSYLPFGWHGNSFVVESREILSCREV